jgi:hypothetical protein
LIGESTSEEFEEFYAAFKDLDVEEGLNSPGKIINNFTFGWWAINNKWKRWKKVVQKLVNREKPENSDLFFDLLTEKSKVDGMTTYISRFYHMLNSLYRCIGLRLPCYAYFVDLFRWICQQFCRDLMVARTYLLTRE